MNPNFKARIRLVRSIDRVSLKLGIVVTPACMQMMEQMITNGVTRMQNQGVLEQEPQLRLAEDNLARCLRELGNEAVDLKTFPNIEDKAFNIVMKRLCPIWPYC